MTFYFACQRATLYDIHYSRSPSLTKLMHGKVPATIPKLLWLTLLSICIHPNGWDHYLLLTKGRDSAHCTWIMHVDTRIVCCDTYSFFSKIIAPKRERERGGERERELRKMRRSLGERDWNKLMYSDCRGRLQHKGSFGFVQNAEKIVQVACFFFSPTSNLPHAYKYSHMVIMSFIHGTLPLT